MSSISLPESFCWTRFGTEAGETIDEILSRKEIERQKNGGIFLWGVGNAIGPSVREFLRNEPLPEVLFSPIKSRPKMEDVSPSRLVRWTRAATLEGKLVNLPAGSVVVSRSDYNRPKTRHYALVCRTTEKLQLSVNEGILPLSNIQNYLSGRKIGASQVTAVVKLAKHAISHSKTEYSVAIRASLVYPYFLELLDPRTVLEDQLEASLR